jgi:isochorismate pyruvate lyase
MPGGVAGVQPIMAAPYADWRFARHLSSGIAGHHRLRGATYAPKLGVIAGRPYAMTTSQESAAQGSPVRRFKNPDYKSQASTLGELRHKIDAIDDEIVALMSRRALYVRDAARFKRDLYQVSAPARQAQVFARVRALAAPHEAAFPGLGDVVDATYRTMVAAFIAGEGRLVDETELIA